MKNLKLFVAPLLGATLLLTACGPKPVDVKTFKEKVRDNYDIAAINTKYSGKTVYATGTNITEELKTKITSAAEDAEENIPYFNFEDTMFSALSAIWILSPAEVIEPEEGSTGKINYFISGGTYTIDMSGEDDDGTKGSMKYVFNEDLVVTHYELKASSGGKTEEMKLDFKYE